jgi:hypothetical protein
MKETITIEISGGSKPYAGVIHYARKYFVQCQRAVAQTNRLPFDRLRANGDMLKPFEFSAHAELVEALNRFEQQPVKSRSQPGMFSFT